MAGMLLWLAELDGWDVVMAGRVRWLFLFVDFYNGWQS